MITEQDLQEAIAECEGQRNPTSNTCMKLAAFYTIRDKMYPKSDPVTRPEPVVYSTAPAPGWNSEVEYKEQSEFSKAIVGMDMDQLIPIMDELMSTLQIVSPRIYSGVMRKLAE